MYTYSIPYTQYIHTSFSTSILDPIKICTIPILNNSNGFLSDWEICTQYNFVICWPTMNHSQSNINSVQMKIHAQCARSVNLFWNNSWFVDLSIRDFKIDLCLIFLDIFAVCMCIYLNRYTHGRIENAIWPQSCNLYTYIHVWA